MEYFLIGLLTASISMNAYQFLTRRKRPKLDDRVSSVIKAIQSLDKEGQALIHLEVIHPDDVFLRSRGRA